MKKFKLITLFAVIAVLFSACEFFEPEIWFVEHKTMDGHRTSVNSVAFSPDGTKIVSGSDAINSGSLGYNNLKIWDASTGECLKTLIGETHDINSVAYSPDGTKIISGSDDKTIKIWDANTGQCLKTLEGHSDDVNSVAYSPDGTKIVSCSFDWTIKIWDANTGECLKTLEGDLDYIYSVAYSPDGTRIISGSFDNTIKMTIKNAFIMSVLQFPKTILMIVLYLVLPVVAILFPQTVPIAFLFGLSAPAFVSAMLYNKFFQKLEDQVLSEQEPEAAESDSEEDERIFKDELDEALITEQMAK